MTTLLLAEDNEQSLYMLQVLMQGHGYTVVTATNGAEALAKARQAPPDLIISDILMPVMDGFTLCRELKSDPLLRRIPLIFYTATYTDPKDEDLALSLGADRFVVKPANPDRLVAIVRELEAKGAVAPADTTDIRTNDTQVMKLYNESLVRKLEKKMRDLEREIGERRQAEQALSRSQERYQSLFDSISDCIFTHDLNGALLSANRATARLLGQDAAGLPGRPISAFLHSPGPDGFAKHYLEPLRRQGTGTGVLVFAGAEGKQRHIEYRSVLVNAENLEPYISVAGRDITEAVQAKEQLHRLEIHLLHLQKMEALGALASGIAHDFNNILGAIIGYIELATLGQAPDSKGLHDLKQALKGCDRAKDLVQQILAFSRQKTMEKKPVDVVRVAKEALKLLRASLPSTIAIHTRWDAPACLVEADPTQIHQVLMNLCTNAAYAMRATGGALDIEIAGIELDADGARFNPDLNPGPYLRLRIGDTGHGMSAETLSRIFEPYFTTKPKGEGTGLGLAVVHGIVKSFNGAITVYSEPGHGTTFNIYLPAIRGSAGDTTAPAARHLPRGNARILLVDDDPILVDIGKQMLDHLGYQVEGYTSSTDAIAAFRSQPDRFDLVLTDITMPHLTGDQMVKMIFALRPDIPVILCTGFSESIGEERARDLGVKAFVMKPLVLEELARVVHAALA